MTTLIQNRDLKRLFGGVAVAAASGLLLGAAMQPQLDARDVAGPQMLAYGGGPRSIPEAGAVSVAAYKGQVPDYVIGTDWTKPPVEEYPEATAPAAETYAANADAVEPEPPMPVKHVAWREPPREPSVYPSMTGDAAYEVELPAPPPPPDTAADGADAG